MNACARCGHQDATLSITCPCCGGLLMRLSDSYSGDLRKAIAAVEALPEAQLLEPDHDEKTEPTPPEAWDDDETPCPF